MNKRIAKKKSTASRYCWLWWWAPTRCERREAVKLRRMNRKTRHICQRFANDLGEMR